MSKTVTMSGGVQAQSATVKGKITFTEVEKAVRENINIPDNKSREIRDFIENNWDQIMDKLPDLENFPVPPEIAEWWPTIVEIIQTLLQASS